jgi:hypothetical protein
LTFDERRHIRASSAFQEITFPMARHSSILDFRRSLANRDGIQDLALSRSPTRSGARVPKVMLAAQVLQQATFEDAATLNEQTPVNGFGRHLHVRIAPKGPSEPARDLLWRPLLREFLRDGAAECRPGGQPTRLRSTAASPGVSIGDGRPVDATPTVSRHFATDRGRRPVE